MLLFYGCIFLVILSNSQIVSINIFHKKQQALFKFLKYSSDVVDNKVVQNGQTVFSVIDETLRPAIQNIQEKYFNQKLCDDDVKENEKLINMNKETVSTGKIQLGAAKKSIDKLLSKIKKLSQFHSEKLTKLQDARKIHQELASKLATAIKNDRLQSSRELQNSEIETSKSVQPVKSDVFKATFQTELEELERLNGEAPPPEQKPTKAPADFSASDNLKSIQEKLSNAKNDEQKLHRKVLSIEASIEEIQLQVNSEMQDQLKLKQSVQTAENLSEFYSRQVGSTKKICDFNIKKLAELFDLTISMKSGKSGVNLSSLNHKKAIQSTTTSTHNSKFDLLKRAASLLVSNSTSSSAVVKIPLKIATVIHLMSNHQQDASSRPVQFNRHIDFISPNHHHPSSASFLQIKQTVTGGGGLDGVKKIIQGLIDGLEAKLSMARGKADASVFCPHQRGLVHDKLFQSKNEISSLERQILDLNSRMKSYKQDVKNFNNLINTAKVQNARRMDKNKFVRDIMMTAIKELKDVPITGNEREDDFRVKLQSEVTLYLKEYLELYKAEISTAVANNKNRQNLINTISESKALVEQDLSDAKSDLSEEVENNKLLVAESTKLEAQCSVDENVSNFDSRIERRKIQIEELKSAIEILGGE